MHNQDDIDKVDIEAANDTLEIEDDLVGIKIGVYGFLEKGSGLNKYTVYLLRGEDKDGQFEVYRRFSEFYALRQVLLQRWPGCFIPAVPDKKVIGKNDEMIKKNRERFLDSFVKKIASLPYLYYSQQFQVLLRSKEGNITDTFEKYPKPSYEDIINRYKDSFSELAGKQINNHTAVKITSFYSFLQATQLVISGYKDIAKHLAIERSALDRKLSNMFTRFLPLYQKTCFIEYVNYDDSKTVFINPGNSKFQDQGQAITALCSKNPYWLIYDLVKYEDRDGEAFMAAIESRTKLENKKADIESKIRDNQRQIEDVSLGNTTVKSFFSTGTKEEMKTKLERQNAQLQKQKNNLINVIDIISALLAYITIDHYREAKKRYYSKIFKAVSTYEINFIQTMYEIWNNCLTETCKLTGTKNQFQDKLYAGVVESKHKEEEVETLIETPAVERSPSIQFTYNIETRYEQQRYEDKYENKYEDRYEDKYAGEGENEQENRKQFNNDEDKKEDEENYV